MLQPISMRDDRLAVRVLAVLNFLLCVTVLWLLRWMLHFDNGDLFYYYQPWYEHILRFGRWASLEGSFANYSPPYLYLLSVASLLHGDFGPRTVIKLAEAPVVAAAAALGWSIVRALGVRGARAVLSGLLLALAPEVVANALLWGQADVLYTVFLLATVRLLLARRPGWAMAAWGVAIAIKLQAVFAGPAILAMLLAGELPWLALVWIPVAYGAMLLPASLAGRPAKQLLMIYRTQVGTYPDVGKNVANPYQILQHWAAFSLPLTERINTLGTLFALAATAALILMLVRRPGAWRGRSLIAAVAMPLLLEPYVLPKMHDRYFFPGNVLLLLLATVDRAMILPAVLTQVSALWVYARFLENKPFDPKYYVLPVILVSVALILLLRHYLGVYQSNVSKEGSR